MRVEIGGKKARDSAKNENAESIMEEAPKAKLEESQEVKTEESQEVKAEESQRVKMENEEEEEEEEEEDEEEDQEEYADDGWYTGKIAVSPNGNRVTGGDFCGRIAAWDPVTGEPLEKFPHRIMSDDADGMVADCVFHPKDSNLLFAAVGGMVGLWNIRGGRCVKRFDDHMQDTTEDEDARVVTCICISADGKLLATGSDSSTIKLWDVESGHCKSTIKGHTKGIRCLRFSADGTRLISGAADRTVRVWEIKGHKSEKIIGPLLSSVMDIAILPNSPKVLVCAGTRVYAVNIETGKYETNGIPTSSDICSIGVCPTDPRYYCIGTASHGIVTREVCSGDLDFATEYFAVTSAKWTPDGKRIVYTEDYGDIGICDVRAHRLGVKGQNSKRKASSDEEEDSMEEEGEEEEEEEDPVADKDADDAPVKKPRRELVLTPGL